MIKCIVVDDEPLGKELVLNHIKEYDDLQVLASFTNSVEARDWLKENKVDLIFMDIEMPGLRGFEVLDGSNNKALVVFITAYKQYALEAYNYNVIDYILKPISTEKFASSIAKTREYYSRILQPNDKPFFFVNSEYNLIKISYVDILYIEGLKDYVKIYLKDKVKPILTRSNLKGIEEYLVGKNFMRIHKSFIISLDHVVAIKRGMVDMGSTEVPLSDLYKPDLLRKLDINS